MPELPEVETVTQSIKRHLVNKSFSSIKIRWPKTLENFSTYDFESKIKGRKIVDIYRRAKYIIFDFKSCIMTVHLRMTGKLYVVPKIDKNKKHISVYLQFSDKYLIYEDTRKFGRFNLYDNIGVLNEKLGIEPLTEDLSFNWMRQNLRNRSRQIKSLLLDQSFIVGLGNIYTDEALWYAKIHPLSKSDSIPDEKIKKLVISIKNVLSKSIESGGTTIRDYTYDYSYVGNYVLSLQAYGRKDNKCNRCDNLITKHVVAQRGTYICLECQKQ